MQWTEDGSPTLSTSGRWQEWMHSRAGALSESDFIYGEALRLLHGLNVPARVLSLGLGVGYNELLTAALCDTQKIPLESLVSFELMPELRNTFVQCLLKQKEVYIDLEVAKAQNGAIDSVAKLFQSSPYDLIKFLLAAREKYIWQIRSEFVPCDLPENNFNCVFFDPFSRGSQPELWQPEVLNGFLSKSLSPVCVFATYAATGDLRRALERQGFDIVRSKGFGYKRESTLAVRKGE